LAGKILKHTKSNSKLTFSPLMQDDPKRRCPDITKAKEVLKWSPLVSLDEGLSKTIQWFELQSAAKQ
ncbi:MAG: SDR family NAD-dependent epimerase/dehydratase, partial [Thaumarchaeota archaeon]|nr:SDR family NAD-dependent epimerase/dehydratase [Nitrososphaerota archaeon]